MSSSANPFLLVSELYRHRALLRQFSRRNIEARHRASFLGLVWTVLTPLISLSIYTVVFGYIFVARFTENPDETNLDYALGIFLGLILFNFISEVLALSPGVIVSQPNFVKKVVFPLEILPAAVVGAALFSAGITLTLALLGVAVVGPGLDWHALLLLAILPPVVLLGLGGAWFFSAFGVFIRDIANIMPFVVQILIYMSAVFYPLARLNGLPPWAQKILLANPMLHAVQSARDVVLFHKPVNPVSLAYLWGSGIAACLIGYFAFRKLRPAFADVL